MNKRMKDSENEKITAEVLFYFKVIQKLKQVCKFKYKSLIFVS